MSYELVYLESGWHVDQAILSEDDKVVAIFFGRDGDSDCMKMGDTLGKVQELVMNYATIYYCDLNEVPDFDVMYELYDKCTLMFFYRNKHIMIDLGTGNNNKINWPFESKDEMIAIFETVYRGASKGRGLVVSPFDYSARKKAASLQVQHNQRQARGSVRTGDKFMNYA